MPGERQTEKTNFHSAKSPHQNTGYEKPGVLVSIAAIIVRVAEWCCRRYPVDKGWIFSGRSRSCWCKTPQNLDGFEPRKGYVLWPLRGNKKSQTALNLAP